MAIFSPSLTLDIEQFVLLRPTATFGLNSTEHPKHIRSDAVFKSILQLLCASGELYLGAARNETVYTSGAFF